MSAHELLGVLVVVVFIGGVILGCLWVDDEA